jgi:hypothetical protein
MASVKPVKCYDVLATSLGHDPIQCSLRLPGLPDPSRGGVFGHPSSSFSHRATQPQCSDLAALSRSETTLLGTNSLLNAL